MSVSLKRGDALVRRRTGVIREVAGFSMKPNSSAPVGDTRYVRLIIPGTTDETRVRLDQVIKTYQPLDF